MQKNNKYSIRKLKTGVASVAVAAILVGISPMYVSGAELMDESNIVEEAFETNVEEPGEQPVEEAVEMELEPEITTEEQIKREPVLFETEYVDNAAWLKGKTVVIQNGVDGERTIIEEVTFSDGEEISREVISNEVTTAPQNQKIERGTLEYTVISETEKNYSAVVRQPWSINSKPWGVYGFELLANGSEYVGSQVTVLREQVTERGTFALISHNGKELGWIDKGALEVHVVKSTKDVQYVVKVTRAWSINSQPWGTDGYITTGNGSEYMGQSVNVVQEKVTNRSTYLLLELNGVEIGWIDYTGVAKQTDIQSVKDVEYTANVTKNWSINTEPWGTTGSKFVTNAASYIGKSVEVTQEKRTSRSTYALISINGKQVGWIDKTGLEEIVVQSTKDVNYMATVTQPWSINTEPWGVKGYELAASGSTYLGQYVEVVQEKVTPRGTYSLIRVNGADIGWLDKGALKVFHTVVSTKDVNYVAKVTKPWSINSAPWGTYQAKQIAAGSKYVGKDVTVVQEKVTERSTYALISFGGKEIGWIDITGLDPLRALYQRDIHYMATVTQPWSINTAPWGTEGATFVVSAKDYMGKDLEVTKELRTQRGTYARVQVGSEVLGWIDVTGLNPYTVLTTKNVTYSATIVKPWSINTQPWGTLQYRPVVNYRSYHGKKAQIIQEKTTRRGTFSLLQIDGKVIGWIDKGALK